MRWLAKPVYPSGYPGFESRSLRHLPHWDTKLTSRRPSNRDGKPDGGRRRKGSQSKKKKSRRSRGRGGGSDRAKPKRVETPPDDLPATAFEKFDLAPAVEKAIAFAGYTEPTEIQDKLIPLALNEKNVVGRSRTGTGKTCAFLTPLIALLDEAEDEDFIREGQPRGPVRILVVVPTRELAKQVAGESEKLTRYLPVRTSCVYGGTRIQKQIEELKTAAIVVGTPGRLLDHIGRRTMDLSKVDAVVLDEVDRMYDLGFRDDVDRLLRASSNRSQTLLMSATINEDVERLIAKHIGDHERVLIESTTMTVDEVDQLFYIVEGRRKQDLLVALVEEIKPPSGIVFVRTRFSVDRLAHKLRQLGFPANEIHSGLPQGRREAILRDFREEKFPLLIATDVAARGLDIPSVTHVFNYDIPDVAEDYVHRVGRTARMGQRGKAITFVTPDDGTALTEIEKLINKEIRQEVYPGFEIQKPEEKAKKAKPPRPPGLPPWANVKRRRR